VEPSAKAMFPAWGKEQVGSIRNAPDARNLQHLREIFRSCFRVAPYCGFRE
jgi:hypothetical protein